MSGAHRLLSLAASVLSLAAPTSTHAAQEAPAAESGEQQIDERGPVRRFLAEHASHLLIAAGSGYLSKIYSDSVGPSTDPLLFDSPETIDTRIREEVAGPGRERGFLEQNGLEAMKLAVPAALVAINVGDGESMARDLVGFTELYFMKQAVVRFAKDVIGRERPALEFASEDGHGPRKIAALDAKDGNHQSFPSGHASGSFAWATYLDLAVARRFGARGAARAVSFTTLYGMAGYISWSRLRRDKHFFTDVVAGAATGYFISRAYYRLNHPDERPAGGEGRSAPPTVRLYPPAPIPGGAVLLLGVRLGAPQPATR